MTYVVGIDIGGTFTDAFAADESGRVASAKTPSTPPDFSAGFLTVIDELAGAFGITTHALLEETEYIVHGTTSTLNALVTGEVATVGFLTTRGHADSIAIMNLEGRYAGLGSDEIQDMVRTAKPAPLVPPRLVREIDERIDHKGTEIVGLDEKGTRQAVRNLPQPRANWTLYCVIRRGWPPFSAVVLTRSHPQRRFGSITERSSERQRPTHVVARSESRT